jgi:hypothetical protein
MVCLQLLHGQWRPLTLLLLLLLLLLLHRC